MTQTMDPVMGVTRCPKCDVVIAGEAQTAERLAERLAQGMKALEHHNEPCKTLTPLVDPSGLPDATGDAA